MCAAGGDEWLPVPATPTFLQAQPSDARHEIELAGPGVALHHRVQVHPCRGKRHMALLDHLRRGVVAEQIEPDFIDFDGLRIHILIVAQPVKKAGT